VAVCNGTVAIHLALAALGIGKGDEVIVPTFTMIASVNPVTYTGAKPVLVDAEPYTWNVDVTKIEEKITKKTKAILPVHIYGHPVDMDPILELAEKYDLYVIEDAAEAHGAEYKGKKTGALGDVGCFSFYANKIITTGEGGMLVTNNEEIAEKARMLRDQAFEKEKRFWHRHLGFNYRMTNLQAAIGVGQMEIIDESVNTRRKNAQIYNSLLKDVEGITLPPEAKWAKNVYWMYTIMIEDSFGISRDELMRILKEKGVDTRPAFYPIHLQPLYAKQYKGEKYPVAEGLSRKGINLPSGNTLTKKEIEYVVRSVIEAKKGG
jgi:perosamine synthetase